VTARFLTLLALAAALGPACKRAPAAPCPFDLGGVWVNASDERYGYRLQDSGAQVTGEFFLREPSGAAIPRAAGEAPITFSLRRDGSALAGTMRGSAATRSGKSCELDFTVRITTCAPAQLQVVSEATAQLGEDCQRLRGLPDGGQIRPDLAEFVWIRPEEKRPAR
jgi:hypothetical protein